MKLVREPLLHFALLGAAFFALFAYLRGPESGHGRVVVSAGDIEHLANTFAAGSGRRPTADELNRLIDDYVREEISYREALALGIDRGDTVVRRRLRQKFEFVMEDSVATARPSDGELQAYLQQHSDLFRTEPTFRFRQVYLSRDRRGDAVEQDAIDLLDQLTTAGPDVDITGKGDAFPLLQEYESVRRSDVVRLFGEDFARRLDALEPKHWAGPVDSTLGVHLVLVRERAGERVPDLEHARPAVERAWLSARRQQAVDAAYERLRARYTVVVDSAAAVQTARGSR